MTRITTLAAALIALATLAGGVQAQKKSTPKVAPKVMLVPTTPEPAPEAAPSPPRLGVSVSPKKDGGLLVHSVLANFPAAEIGLEAGDVILTVNSVAMNVVTDLATAIDDAIANKNGELSILVQDARGTGLVQLDTTIALEAPVATFAAVKNAKAPKPAMKYTIGKVTRKKIK